MNEVIETNWKGQMAFESSIDGFAIKMDADPQFGGTKYGPRPKPMLLSSLAGCTGMDVVSILNKKRVAFKALKIIIDAELTETHPKYYQKIKLIFEFTGENFAGNEEVYTKISRAVALSSENYCGVSAMIKYTCEIISEIRLINS